MEYLEHFRLIFLFFLAFLSYRHVNREILPICQRLEEEEEDVRQEQEVEEKVEVEGEDLQGDGEEAVVPQQNAEIGQEIVDEQEDGLKEALGKKGLEVEEISDCSSVKDNEEAKRDGKTKLIKKFSKPKRKDSNPKKSPTSLQESPIIDLQVS